MEYCGRFTLKDKIERRSLTLKDTKKIFYDIVTGVNYLHNQNIAHYDLKLENIMVNGSKVKIVDFGFSREKADKENDFIAGTPNYMSPELIRRERHWPKPADVWSLGVILYYMISKKFPFFGKKETDLMLSVISCDVDYSVVEDLEARRLLERIWRKDPRERVDCEGILRSGFFGEEEVEIEEVEEDVEV